MARADWTPAGFGTIDTNHLSLSDRVIVPLFAASTPIYPVRSRLQRVDFFLIHKAPANDLNTGSLLAPIKVDAL